MSTQFRKRSITLKFRLGTGSFGDTGANTATATGLSVNATISKTGAVGMHRLQATVYGLDPSIATQISTLGKPLLAGRNNLVSVLAGDDDGGMPVVFIGTIQTAWSDYEGAPDVGVEINAFTGMLDSLRPLPPTSFNGGADVATMISGLAGQMGYAFENNGVSVQLKNQYLSGTGREQAYAAAKAANINIVMDDQPNASPTIAIWPKDGARGGAIPNISPTSGMVGYPRWTDQGVDVQMLFNPSVLVGGQIQISGSQVKNANSVWPVFQLTHELESRNPDGPWFTTARCSYLGQPLPTPSQ